MFKIRIVAVGRVKESYFADGIKEYEKRIGRYADFSISEVEECTGKGESAAERETCKEKEADRILPHLNGKVFALAIEGKEKSSEELAKTLENVKNAGGEITFVIGGSYGLSDRVKEKAELLSFSKMTFPHTLFRLMLSEQIYRALSISAGSSYHK